MQEDNYNTCLQSLNAHMKGDISQKITYATAGIHNYVPPIMMDWKQETQCCDTDIYYWTNKPYLEAKWGEA